MVFSICLIIYKEKNNTKYEEKRTLMRPHMLNKYDIRKDCVFV